MAQSIRIPFIGCEGVQTCEGFGKGIDIKVFFLRKMIVTLICLGKWHISQFVVQFVTPIVAIFQTA